MRQRTGEGVGEDAAPEGRGAAPPYPAATLVLTRGTGQDREVLLLRRPAHSAFAPDAWVFAGGRVDPGDLVFAHDRLSAGPSLEHWARELGLDDAAEAAAYAVAALREAWEETGILLSEPERAGSAGAEARRQLLAGECSLAELLERQRIRLATGRLRYVAHWITPDWLPRRFGTRFFHAEVGRGARCVLLGDELTAYRWVTPSVALAAGTRGEIRLLPPTIDTLRRLAAGEI